MFEVGFAVPLTIDLNDEPVYRLLRGYGGVTGQETNAFRVKNLDSFVQKSFVDIDGKPKISVGSLLKAGSGGLSKEGSIGSNNE